MYNWIIKWDDKFLMCIATSMKALHKETKFLSLNLENWEVGQLNGGN